MRQDGNRTGATEGREQAPCTTMIAYSKRVRAHDAAAPNCPRCETRAPARFHALPTTQTVKEKERRQHSLEYLGGFATSVRYNATRRPMLRGNLFGPTNDPSPVGQRLEVHGGSGHRLSGTLLLGVGVEAVRQVATRGKVKAHDAVVGPQQTGVHRKVRRGAAGVAYVKVDFSAEGQEENARSQKKNQNSRLAPPLISASHDTHTNGPSVAFHPLHRATPQIVLEGFRGHWMQAAQSPSGTFTCFDEGIADYQIVGRRGLSLPRCTYSGVQHA